MQPSSWQRAGKLMIEESPGNELQEFSPPVMFTNLTSEIQAILSQSSPPFRDSSQNFPYLLFTAFLLLRSIGAVVDGTTNRGHEAEV